MLKKDLTEREICTQYIYPALIKAGWNPKTQIREEVTFTDGRIYVKGNKTTRGKKKRADYIIYYKPNIPIAIIEAKKNSLSIRAGIQQALEYAHILDIPSAYSSNGDGFYEHNKVSTGNVEQELSLDNFPSPDQLWTRYKQFKGIETAEQEKITTQNYFYDGSGKSTRYYQQVAINRTLEAISKGQKRILLTMATGTGKTYTAFQIIHSLWKSKTKKRILFLADREALINQTQRGDFKHFKNNMTFIRKKHIDHAYEIYLSLYQGLTNYDDDTNAYKEFSPDFFDLVVIDECHRGSAKEDSAWREILDYFSSATHIGLTATPKETKDVSSTDYFGEPIYTYSLKQGIEDGFLAPYKVLRIGTNVDLEGWRPEKGQSDTSGNLVEDREYNSKDYDRNIIIEERTKEVARRITEFLKKNDRFAKTIVFCIDIDHASRMRTALANANCYLVKDNNKYVMQITGDNNEGKNELDNFIDPEQRYPVIATTSKLLTTGVDAQTCKLIVLDSNIVSMTEFKQIIGRGTRIREDFGKTFFTIMDFRNVTKLFADPDFDGDPVRVKEIKHNEEIPDESPEDEISTDEINTEEISTNEGFENYDLKNTKAEFVQHKEKREKIIVNGVDVSILNERVQYLDANGKLITGSLKDYTKGKLLEKYASLDDFINNWNSTEKKQAIVDELIEQGVILDDLQVDVDKEMDIFDLVCHVAYDQKPLTRAERANNVKKRDYFTKYGDQARKVLEILLEKYADNGIGNIEDINILKVKPLDKIGTPMEIIKLFGNKKKYMQAVNELENQIYMTEYQQTMLGMTSS